MHKFGIIKRSYLTATEITYVILVNDTNMDETELSVNLRERLDEHREAKGGSAGTLVLDEQRGNVGDPLTLKGRNLPPNEPLDIVWNTVQGEWAMVQANEVIDVQYHPRTETVLSVRTDETGSFSDRLEVPEDYGGTHEIELQDASEDTLASAKYTITPHFELDRTTAPLGEHFHLTGYGLGTDRISTTVQVTWDNGYVGTMTAVQNGGTANARIRAVGPPGDHLLQVWPNHEGAAYLPIYTTAVVGELEEEASKWFVEVTEPDGAPPTAQMDTLLEEQPLDAHVIDPDRETAAELEISPTSGQSGTEAVLEGRGFPAETTVDLIWYTHAGHRFMDDPIRPVARPDALPTVESDEDGTFAVDITVPTDIGETRPIAAEVDGESVATTGFMLQPEIVDVSSTAGPAGTTITIKLGGIGWALYDNNYCVLYDNKMVGYVCSHNRLESDHDPSIVEFNLTACGEPGYHFIDIVPTFNENQVGDYKLENRPHLSYLDNHPLRPLAGMQLTFEVTE